MQIKFPTEEDVIADEAFINKVLRNKLPILAGVAFFIALALAVSGGGSKRMKRERDFFSLSHSHKLLEKGEGEFNEVSLSKLLKLYPEAEADFAYFLRDDKIIEREVQKAASYEQGIISRLSYIPPLYLEFMKVVQLMEGEESNKAFESLGKLKGEIEKEGVMKYPRLYCFVLSRYAFVLEQNGQVDDAKVARQQLAEFISKENLNFDMVF